MEVKGYTFTPCIGGLEIETTHVEVRDYSFTPCIGSFSLTPRRGGGTYGFDNVSTKSHIHPIPSLMHCNYYRLFGKLCQFFYEMAEMIGGLGLNPCLQ